MPAIAPRRGFSRSSGRPPSVRNSAHSVGSMLARHPSPRSACRRAVFATAKGGLQACTVHPKSKARVTSGRPFEVPVRPQGGSQKNNSWSAAA